MSTAIQSTSRTLEIDGMNGDACVKRVAGALNGVKDVTTQSVKVGCATIKADQAGCDAACEAVKRAGYSVQEGTPTGNDRNAIRGGSGCTTGNYSQDQDTTATASM